MRSTCNTDNTTQNSLGCGIDICITCVHARACTSLTNDTTHILRVWQSNLTLERTVIDLGLKISATNETARSHKRLIITCNLGTINKNAIYISSQALTIISIIGLTCQHTGKLVGIGHLYSRVHEDQVLGNTIEVEGTKQTCMVLCCLHTKIIDSMTITIQRTSEVLDRSPPLCSLRHINISYHLVVLGWLQSQLLEVTSSSNQVWILYSTSTTLFKLGERKVVEVHVILIIRSILEHDKHLALAQIVHNRETCL